MSFKTAGIIIVGDEILKGHISDVNSNYMCKRFHAVGVRVCRISTVPDDVDEIAEEISKFSKKYNIVITSGGIGPTHDDITYEGVAKGLNDKIILHSEMANVIRDYFPYGSNLDDNPALKMALIPQKSKLIYVLPKERREYEKSSRNNEPRESKMSFPVVQVGNVYILPGMTEWLKLAFDHLQKIFENAEISFYTMKLFVNSTEFEIIEQLNKAVYKYKSSVIFGSYPSLGGEDLKITLESTSMDDVTDAYAYLKSILPKYLSYGLNAKEVDSVYELTNGSNSLANAVARSLNVVEQAYAQYKMDEIYVSFNGGKDCTVLLHLIWAFNVKRNINNKINAFYLKPDYPFPEMEEFIESTTKRYNLNLITGKGPAAKEQLSVLVKNNPSLKAIFLGTRRTDPYASSLGDFQMCDADWPQVMRINPLLDWSYSNVWDFLRVLAVPYCTLYNEGYTSVGNMKNTSPNPALEVEDIDARVKKFEPAYKLKDASLERQGRT